MKKLIFSLALCAPLICRSQTNEAIQLQLDTIKHQMKMSGKQLVRYERQMLVGIGMEVGGTALTYIGLDINASEGDASATPLIVAGVVIDLAGLFLSIASHHHIGLAGMYLRNNALTYDLPIKKRRVQP